MLPNFDMHSRALVARRISVRIKYANVVTHVRCAVLTVEQRVPRIGHVHARHVLNPVYFGRRTAGCLALNHRHVTDFDDTRGRTQRNDGKTGRCFFGCEGVRIPNKGFELFANEMIMKISLIHVVARVGGREF